MRKNISLAAVAAGTMLATGALGCATDDDIDTAESVPHLDNIQVKAGSVFVAPDFNLALSFRTHNGELVRDNGFAAKGAVFIGTAALDNTKAVRPMDWMFELRNTDGTMVSTDLFGCRGFHVASNGAIDGVAAATGADGKSCSHIISKLPGSGDVLVNLMPFANVKANHGGLMVYQVAAAPKAKKFPVAAPMMGTFTVKAATDDQTCVCGDGMVEEPEDCDDGNTADGDGCSRDCVTETVTGTLPE